MAYDPRSLGWFAGLTLSQRRRAALDADDFHGGPAVTSIPAIFRALNRARVRYVLVGGYASVVLGVPRATLDVDVAIDLRAARRGGRRS